MNLIFRLGMFTIMAARSVQLPVYSNFVLAEEFVARVPYLNLKFIVCYQTKTRWDLVHHKIL